MWDSTGHSQTSRDVLASQCRNPDSTGITCLMSRGVLITGTAVSMYCSSDLVSIGCLIVPAMVNDLRLYFNVERWKPRKTFCCFSRPVV